MTLSRTHRTIYCLLAWWRPKISYTIVPRRCTKLGEERCPVDWHSSVQRVPHRTNCRLSVWGALTIGIHHKKSLFECYTTCTNTTSIDSNGLPGPTTMSTLTHANWKSSYDQLIVQSHNSLVWHFYFGFSGIRIHANFIWVQVKREEAIPKNLGCFHWNSMRIFACKTLRFKWRQRSFATNRFTCRGGPGVIMSRETLRRVAPHIPACLKNLYSTHEDVEVGRCVQKFAGIPCTWNYEVFDDHFTIVTAT